MSGLDGREKTVCGRSVGTNWGYLLAIDELIELANSHATRALTIEECQKYLHQDECLRGDS